MPCDGVAVLAAQKVRFDVLSELASPPGRKALSAYFGGKGVEVLGTEILADSLWIRVPGGNLVVRQSGDDLRVLRLGNPALPELPGLARALADLAGLVLAQRVAEAVRKAGTVDRVSVTPRGTVIEARL